MCLWCGLRDLSRPSRRQFMLSMGAAAVTFAGRVGVAEEVKAPASAQNVEDRSTRLITISTKELTDPDIAVSPDGRWLVFTALGHLFQLPTRGGTAKQLTFGPYYDSSPAISPDGARVAFISDRMVSSQDNLFVLDLATGQIHQLTDEAWVDRPVWSPDGNSLAFLSYEPVGPLGNYWFVGPKTMKTQVRRIGLADRKPETLTEAGFVHAVAFLADGRRIKHRIRSMPGFKSAATAAIILSGIEVIHMMRKRQARYPCNPRPSIAEQFAILAA